MLYMVSSAVKAAAVREYRFKGDSESKAKCGSLPPSRPETPPPPSRLESTGTLLKKFDALQTEIDHHRDRADAHLLTNLMTGSESEGTLYEKHRDYADKCEEWQANVVREIRRKLHIPQRGSLLSTEIKPDDVEESHPACQQNRLHRFA